MVASQLLRQPEVKLRSLVSDQKVALDLDPESPEHDLATLETTIKYAGYLEQEMSRAERSRRDDRRRIAPRLSRLRTYQGSLGRWSSDFFRSARRPSVRPHAFQG